MLDAATAVSKTEEEKFSRRPLKVKYKGSMKKKPSNPINQLEFLIPLVLTEMGNFLKWTFCLRNFDSTIWCFWKKTELQKFQTSSSKRLSKLKPTPVHLKFCCNCNHNHVHNTESTFRRTSPHFQLVLLTNCTSAAKRKRRGGAVNSRQWWDRAAHGPAGQHLWAGRKK